MAAKWNDVWEKVLSALLTANIAVMGWLWSNVARLADKLDRHASDREIHQPIDQGALVGRREYEAWQQHDKLTTDAVAERLGRIEQRIERITIGRNDNAS